MDLREALVGTEQEKEVLAILERGLGPEEDVEETLCLLIAQIEERGLTRIMLDLTLFVEYIEAVAALTQLRL